jgi:hypothetical protein
MNYIDAAVKKIDEVRGYIGAIVTLLAADIEKRPCSRL